MGTSPEQQPVPTSEHVFDVKALVPELVVIEDKNDLLMNREPVSKTARNSKAPGTRFSLTANRTDGFRDIGRQQNQNHSPKWNILGRREALKKLEYMKRI